MSKTAQRSGRSEEVAVEGRAREPMVEVVARQADEPDAMHTFVDRNVWQGLVKSDEDVEYLYRVGRRFLFWQNLANLLQVIGATAVAAMILADGPMPYTAAISAIVGAVALLAILFRFSEKACGRGGHGEFVQSYVKGLAQAVGSARGGRRSDSLGART